MPSPTFRFGIVTDPQYCSDPTVIYGRHFPLSIHKLDEALATINQSDVTFTVNLGDTIDRDATSYDTIMPLFKKFWAPVFFLLGNHDYYKDWPNHERSSEMYRETAVMKELGMDKAYYDFEHGGWRFIALNGNDISTRATPPDDERYQLAEQTLKRLEAAGAANARSWNGAIGKTQLAWLRRTLDDAQAKNQKVIVLNHYPAYPTLINTLWDPEDLLELFDRYDNIVAYLNGHDHDGRYAQRNGVHYLNFVGMVDTTENAYAVVTVEPDRLIVKGHGREPSRDLLFTA